MNVQIKSKQRVIDHGEVFTSQKDVDAMLNLVNQETSRVDSRFLEPACGTGNFLSEILKRKLCVAKRLSIPPKKKKPNQIEFERQSLIAIASLYGVDLLFDNVQECKKRLYELWEQEYDKLCTDIKKQSCKDAIKYILDCNIVCGNALTLKKVNEKGKDQEEPIIFSEWSFVTENKIQKKDYRFDKLLSGDYKPLKKQQKEEINIHKINAYQMELFEYLDEEHTQKKDDDECLSSIIADYWKIHEYAKDPNRYKLQS